MTDRTEGQERVAALQGLRQVVESAVDSPENREREARQTWTARSTVAGAMKDAQTGIPANCANWHIVSILLRDEVELLTAEVEQLRRELEAWTSGRRRKSWPVIESAPDGIHYAAGLVRAQGTEGGDEHDRLLREASQRLKALHDAAQVLLADRDVLSAEVSRLREQLATAVVLPQNWTQQVGWLFDVDEVERYTKVVRLVQMWQGLRDGTGDTEAEESAPVSESVPATPQQVAKDVCGVCGNPGIQYQPFSGGKEYFCPSCEDVHPYGEGQAPRRAQMLQDGKFTELKQEMSEHLDSLRASAPSEASPEVMHDDLADSPIEDRSTWTRVEPDSINRSSSSPPSGGDSDTTPRVWTVDDPHEPPDWVVALAQPPGSYWKYLIRGTKSGWYFSNSLAPRTAIGDGSGWGWAFSRAELPLTQVTQVSDVHGDVWTWVPGTHEWSSPETQNCAWSYMAKKWAPLTEVSPSLPQEGGTDG